MWAVKKDISKFTMPALTPTEANLHRKSSPIARGCGICSWAGRFYSLLALREGDINFFFRARESLRTSKYNVLRCYACEKFLGTSGNHVCLVDHSYMYSLGKGHAPDQFSLHLFILNTVYTLEPLSDTCIPVAPPTIQVIIATMTS